MTTPTGVELSDFSREAKIELAARFAAFCHRSERYGDQPYMVHLEAVAEEVRRICPSPHRDVSIVLAYLHDTLESVPDAELSLTELFGIPMAFLVKTLTATGPRKVRAIQVNRQIVKCLSPVVGIVKAADRICNIRASVALNDKRRLKMYKEEHAALRAAIATNLSSAEWGEGFATILLALDEAYASIQ